MQGCWDILFYPLFKQPQTGLTLTQNVNLNSLQTSHGIKQVFSNISERKRRCGVFWVTLLSVESAAIECAWAWDFRATGRTEAVPHPLQGK